MPAQPALAGFSPSQARADIESREASANPQQDSGAAIVARINTRMMYPNIDRAGDAQAAFFLMEDPAASGSLLPDSGFVLTIRLRSERQSFTHEDSLLQLAAAEPVPIEPEREGRGRESRTFA